MKLDMGLLENGVYSQKGKFHQEYDTHWFYKVVPPSYKLVYNPMKTIDISPTKTIEKLELCAPTERYRTGA